MSRRLPVRKKIGARCTDEEHLGEADGQTVNRDDGSGFGRRCSDGLWWRQCTAAALCTPKFAEGDDEGAAHGGDDGQI